MGFLGSKQRFRDPINSRQNFLVNQIPEGFLPNRSFIVAVSNKTNIPGTYLHLGLFKSSRKRYIGVK